MSWINIITYEEAGPKLKQVYDRVKGPQGNIDNVLAIHSLRPHTLIGHMTLYKNVLHHSDNTLPKWYLELLGIYVSDLNECDYCVKHHTEGLKRLTSKTSRIDELLNALESGRFDKVLDQKLLSGLLYAKRLTRQLNAVSEEVILELRSSGLTDGEILEINQVVSYFNYVNRTVIGLGVNTDGDVLGLSPNNNEDPDNWVHR
jgi:uncharacterized peroxidase-related enzyme